MASPPDAPVVVLLATGGTIAGAGDSAAALGYSSASLPIDQLLATIPELGQLARLEAEDISRVGSQDMNPETWLVLARRIRRHLGREEVCGVVVTHGTDTLEETAYFLDQVLDVSTPVVLTGAMRPATGISPDGPRNLFDAVVVATQDGARERGVLVVVDESIHSARGVTKTNTNHVSTFRSHDHGVIGSVLGRRALFLRPPRRWRRPALALELEGLETLPMVHVLYTYAGLEPEWVDAALERGAAGLVLAGVGNGNAPRAVLERLEAAVRQGVPVVRSTRAGSGIVSRNVEIDDDRAGFIAANDLNPAKARVQLQLCLAAGVPPAEMQAYFEL